MVMAQSMTLPRDQKEAKKKKLAATLKKIWPLYIFLLPAIIYILIFNYYPMYGAQIAFKNYRMPCGGDYLGHSQNR